MAINENEINIRQLEENKIKSLIMKSKDVQDSLVELITNTSGIERLEIIEKYMNWLLIKTKKVYEEPNFNPSSIPELKRGDVILVNLGFNIGDEYGGEHVAIVLRDSNINSKRVLILPITSQEPKNKNNPIYVKIGNISGLDPTKIHWANIFNVHSVSKQRIIYPPTPKKVDGKILTRISGAIKSQIALR